MGKRLSFVLASLLMLIACNPESSSDVIATAIKLNTNELILEKGGNEVLSVTYTPSNTTKKDITWVSSNTSVATVNDGIVVGVAPGSTDIIAKCGDVTDKCKVTVVISAQSIVLNKPSIQFKALGQTEKLVATVTPDNTTETIEWSSSNESVATVKDGLVSSVSAGIADITVKCGCAHAECSVSVEIVATTIMLNKSSLILHYGESETLIASVEPSNSTDSVEWSSSDKDVATVQNGCVSAVSNGLTTITAKAGAQKAECIVSVREPFELVAVDLGLSVKWANANLGASEPEDYGERFAWGETTSKSDFSWSTYKWCNGSESTLTRYCPSDKVSYWGGPGSPDNKKDFRDYDYADDAARAKLGGKWRVPTPEECTELINQCTWTWTNQVGMEGFLVTGTNGNSIFLPTTVYGSSIIGRYWASSLYGGIYSTPDIACRFSIQYDGKKVSTVVGSRYYGHAIRPVCE